MNNLWQEVKRLTDEHGYMSGIDRMSDRVKATSEVFTPTDLVIKVLQNTDIEKLGPGKTVIDPSCGDGQFLVPAKWVKVVYFNMSEEDALNDIYGVDIMRDNVDLCKKRLGGGNIIMGNTLDPNTRLPDQLEYEYMLMKDWFGAPTLVGFFGPT